MIFFEVKIKLFQQLSTHISLKKARTKKKPRQHKKTKQGVKFCDNFGTRIVGITVSRCDFKQWLMLKEMPAMLT